MAVKMGARVIVNGVVIATLSDQFLRYSIPLDTVSLTVFTPLRTQRDIAAPLVAVQSLLRVVPPHLSAPSAPAPTNCYVAALHTVGTAGHTRCPMWYLPRHSVPHSTVIPRGSKSVVCVAAPQ